MGLVLTTSSCWNGEKPQTQTPEKKIISEKKYICPMHPQIVSHEKGSCPICGMDLVVASQDSQTSQEESSPTIELSQVRQQMIGIKLAKVVKKNLFKSIRAPGRAAFDPELYTAQSEYLQALRQWRKVRNAPVSEVVESTRQMIRSSKIRLKVLGLSDGQIRDLAKKGRQSEALLVGGKGQESWVYADVFEIDLPHIQKGHAARIGGSFLQGQELAGEVVSVDQIINPKTRTAKVRIRLLQPKAPIRPESFVSVTILAPLGSHITIPLEAILDTGRESLVFVKKSEGEFEPRVVAILLETDADAAIGSGVKEGEEVVVGGNFMLDSESRLKKVIRDAP